MSWFFAVSFFAPVVDVTLLFSLSAPFVFVVHTSFMILSHFVLALQCQVPFFVVSNMSKIRKPSGTHTHTHSTHTFMRTHVHTHTVGTPAPDRWVKSALNALGENAKPRLFCGFGLFVNCILLPCCLLIRLFVCWMVFCVV